MREKHDKLLYKTSCWRKKDKTSSMKVEMYIFTENKCTFKSGTNNNITIIYNVYGCFTGDKVAIV